MRLLKPLSAISQPSHREMTLRIIIYRHNVRLSIPYGGISPLAAIHATVAYAVGIITVEVATGK